MIIGIGSGDMQFMDILTGQGDESGKLRYSNGVPITREVVNFVTFNEFQGNASQCVVEALREVPEQFVQYFINSGAKPLPAQPVPDFTQDDVRSQSTKSSRKSHQKKKTEKRHSLKAASHGDNAADFDEDD